MLNLDSSVELRGLMIAAQSEFVPSKLHKGDTSCVPIGDDQRRRQPKRASLFHIKLLARSARVAFEEEELNALLVWVARSLVLPVEPIIHIDR